jgi:hypothetical protein
MLTLIFLIAFPFAIWNAWKTIQRAKESVAWPSATGTITASGTKKVMFRSQPRVAYSYAVNGTSYTAERISFAAGVPPKETASVVARYPVGKEVTVHYAPEKPSEAVLEPGTNRNVMAQLRLLITCFVIIVVVNIGLYFLRSIESP